MKNFWTISLLSTLLLSCTSKAIFVASEQDAKIYVNNELKGQGKTSVIFIPKKTCVYVSVRKEGFLNSDLNYCPIGNYGAPEEKFISLNLDDSYNASVKNDYANKDFEQTINSKFSENEAWKIISQIITSYFDNLEMADRETGYMKTAWQIKNFSNKTIRTRVILRQSGSNPLKYKIKIVSEYADQPNTSVRSDEMFKEWDRVLKSYDGLITEFQTRLGEK